MKLPLKIGFILASVYAALFLLLLVKAIYWPHFDGAEWFLIYSLSLPVSAGVETLTRAGYFVHDTTARVCSYAAGSVVFYFAVGNVIGWIFRGRKLT